MKSEASVMRWNLAPMRHYNLNLSSVACDENALSEADAVVLVTNHDSLDYELVLNHAKLIIDTRGVFSRSAKVVPA